MKYLLISIVVVLSGCAGKIYTVQDPQFENGKTEGVLFYGYKPVEKKVLFDRIRHPKTGNITHSMYEVPGSAKYCAPNVITKKVIEADYSTVYAIKYEAGLFETNKFGVELDKGTLKSVNSESTPGVKTAVESLQGIASLREDILDGFVEASDASAQKTLGILEGAPAQTTPIKCSTNE
ncbi:hypothetical protein OLMES_3205 [Oleiphilus messinensis]|uniref:Lipoprotein n=1 Tax=Oleiphilus messinensis TaxID=141451 RepID=A0A1Y0IBV3_9GAMM|nr:hypothetical protein [Oleiphilus messinensis]ARU57246.1 hypothetical protein OLMES_3205 [Oleiphilus messinensis]